MKDKTVVTIPNFYLMPQSEFDKMLDYTEAEGAEKCWWEYKDPGSKVEKPPLLYFNNPEDATIFVLRFKL